MDLTPSTTGRDLADLDTSTTAPPASSSASRVGPASRARAVTLVVGGASLAAVAFQQSPANEALRTNLGLDVLERTGDPVRVGLVVAATTVVIEMVPAVLICAGLHLEGGAVRWLKERILRRRPDLVAPDDRPSVGRRAGAVGADVAVALGLGAGLVAMRRHLADPEPSLRRDLAASGWAALLIAAVSGLIGYLLAGGLSRADDVGLGGPARWVVENGADTRFWVGALVVGYAVVLAVRAVRRLLHRRTHGRWTWPDPT